MYIFELTLEDVRLNVLILFDFVVSILIFFSLPVAVTVGTRRLAWVCFNPLVLHEPLSLLSKNVRHVPVSGLPFGMEQFQQSNISLEPRVKHVDLFLEVQLPVGPPMLFILLYNCVNGRVFLLSVPSNVVDGLAKHRGLVYKIDPLLMVETHLDSLLVATHRVWAASCQCFSWARSLVQSIVVRFPDRLAFLTYFVYVGRL